MSNEAKAQPEAKVTAGKLFKGCGCLTAVVALALGILIIGDFDAGSWASALIAILVAGLVFGLSGVNGFWEK
jgi:hypothetical protein